MDSTGLRFIMSEKNQQLSELIIIRLDGGWFPDCGITCEHSQLCLARLSYHSSSNFSAF